MLSRRLRSAVEAGRIAIRSHFPLSIAFGASLAYFGAVAVLRGFLTPEAFGAASLFLTYLSLVTTFGLLGIEQVVVRTAVIQLQGQVTIDRDLSAALLVVLPMLSLALALGFEIAFFELGGLYWATVLTVFCMFAHNCLKLTRRFGSALVASNAWKIAVFLAAATVFLSGELTVARLVTSYAAWISVIAVFAGCQLLFLRNRFRLAQIRVERFPLILSFLLSMFLLAFTNNIDRLLAEETVGLARLGDYFFAMTVVVFPVTVVASYIGVRTIVAYRTSWPDAHLVRKLGLLGLGGVMLSLGIVLIVWLGNQYIPGIDVTEESVVFWAALILLAGIRMSYSVASAVLGAHGSVVRLMRLNVGVLGGLIIFSVVVLLTVNSVTELAVAFVGLWLWRLLLFGSAALALRNEARIDRVPA